MGFEPVLPMLLIVCASLLSSTIFSYIISDSEAEALRKILWKKFEVTSDLTHDMENLQKLVFFVEFCKYCEIFYGVRQLYSDSTWKIMQINISNDSET